MLAAAGSEREQLHARTRPGPAAGRRPATVADRGPSRRPAASRAAPAGPCSRASCGKVAEGNEPEPGQQVADPAALAGGPARRGEDDPPVAAREGCRGEAAGRSVRLEAASQRGGDDAQLLEACSPRSRGSAAARPAGSLGARLDVEDDHDVPLAGRVEALDDRRAEASRRPPVDPADRIAGRVRRGPRRSGSGRRSGPCGWPARPASRGARRGPSWPRAAGRTIRVTGIERSSSAIVRPRRSPAARWTWSKRCTPRCPADELDPAGDPAVRRERPAVAQLGPAADLGRLRLDDRRPGRRELELVGQDLGDPHPGDRQRIAVADRQHRSRAGRRRRRARARSRGSRTTPRRPRSTAIQRRRPTTAITTPSAAIGWLAVAPPRSARAIPPTSQAWRPSPGSRAIVAISGSRPSGAASRRLGRP